MIDSSYGSRGGKELHRRPSGPLLRAGFQQPVRADQAPGRQTALHLLQLRARRRRRVQSLQPHVPQRQSVILEALRRLDSRGTAWGRAALPDSRAVHTILSLIAHSGDSLVLIPLLALLWWREGFARDSLPVPLAAGLLLGVWALLVGVARVALGVHYLLDVLAGYLLGLAIGAGVALWLLHGLPW